MDTRISKGGAELSRKISLPLLTLYGLGTTIGAGVYVVIGETAASAGYYLPVAFLLAAVIAGLSAASFAELATRFPVSAGEAAYVRAGLGSKDLALGAGLAVTLSGAISSATLLQGGTGYLREIVAAPEWLLFIVLLALIGGLVAWGILKSLMLTALFTLIEIGGLILVIAYAPADPLTLAAQAANAAAPFDLAAMTGLSASILLAFFAFIGFEDMVNVAEEVKRPRRTLPIAIALTLVITTLLYIWIALIVLSALTPEVLGREQAPLAAVFDRLSGQGTAMFSLIAIFAVLNGAIIQIVMGSRVIYGLARLGQLPAVLGRVSERTNTPLIATGIICAVILVLGLTLSLRNLAQMTSAVTLAVFALVNFSLWRLKRQGVPPSDIFTVPAVVPLLGFLTSSSFLVLELVRRVTIIGG